MANLGEKAQFIDLGGGRGDEADVMTKVLGRIPELMKKLDVENKALNGQPITDTIE
ncbi:MAG: hypothetical protein FWG10_04835 [Eubacteriaceae bacterium]|jgi:hypothetical protein|nr:hypothetical protein [Eubacteriaceae bacterium]